MTAVVQQTHLQSDQRPFLRRLAIASEPWLYSAPALILIVAVMLVPLALGLATLALLWLVLRDAAGGAAALLGALLFALAPTTLFKYSMVASGNHFETLAFTALALWGALRLQRLGATPASFMAYGMARRSSRHPERFGQGAVEGVLAPEAANNAAGTGSILPMLVLGIPYSTFINNLLQQVKPVDFHTGVLKGAIFGLLIGIIACGNGLKVTGGAAGVGRATTNTVVESIVAIIIADMIFTAIFYALDLV